MELNDIFKIQFKKTSHRDDNVVIPFSEAYGENNVFDHVKNHGGLEGLLYDLGYDSVEAWQKDRKEAGLSTDLTDSKLVEELHEELHANDDDIPSPPTDPGEIGLYDGRSSQENEYSTLYPGDPEYWRSQDTK